jgi:hypothetical protein
MKKLVYLLIFCFGCLSFAQTVDSIYSVENDSLKNYNIILIAGNKYSDIERNKKEYLNTHQVLNYTEKKYFVDNRPILTLHEDKTIDTDEYIDYNIIVFNSTLTIKRNLNGAIAAVNGDIILLTNSEFKNNCYLFNSSLYADSNTTANDVICVDLVGYDKDENIYSAISLSYPKFRYHETDFFDVPAVDSRYNRVEGFYFGVSQTKKYYWDGRKNYSNYSSFGYGTGNHRWTGLHGQDFWLGNMNRTEIGGTVFSIIGSKDNKLIDQNENTLAAFFIREDFKDYYLTEGYNIHLSQYYNFANQLRISYSQENFRSQKTNVNWALFGGKKRFRENPEVQSGILRSLTFSFRHIDVSDWDYFPIGWNIAVDYEITNGVASFNRLMIDIRNYFLFLDDYSVSVRVLAGTANNELPMQKSFELGGLGSIPASPFKSLGGNRMLLANFDYAVPFDFDVKWLPFNEYYRIDMKHKMSLIFSYNIGFATSSFSNNLFKGFVFEKDFVAQDMGIALGFLNNKGKIGIAFRLDKSKPPIFVFRISRPF